MNYFILRPGQSPISVNPQDTLVGFKGNSPLGGVGNIEINQTLDINVSNTETMQRMIDDNNRRLVDDLRRIVKE